MFLCLLQARDARKQFASFCAVQKVASADDLSEVIRQKGHLLAVIDEQWPIESAMLKMLCGATADSRASSQIMLALPSADRDTSVAQALSVLEGHAASQAMKLSPAGIQASLKFIVTHLGNLNMGIPLNIDLASCSKLASGALAAFEFFCVLPIGECGVKGQMKGREAYKKCFEHTQKVADTKEPVKQEMIDMLELYRWLSPPDREAEVTELITKLQKAREAGGAPAKKVRKTPVQEGGASSSSSAPAAKAKDRATAMFNS